MNTQTNSSNTGSTTNGNLGQAQLHDERGSTGGQGRKVVYVVNERNGKSYWTRIGFGSTNKDGSMNLKLDAIPCAGGTMQVRDWEPRDDTKAGGSGDGAGRAAFA